MNVGRRFLPARQIEVAAARRARAEGRPYGGRRWRGDEWRAAIVPDPVRGGISPLVLLWSKTTTTSFAVTGSLLCARCLLLLNTTKSGAKALRGPIGRDRIALPLGADPVS